MESTPIKKPVEAAMDYAASGWKVFPVHAVVDGRCGCGNDHCSSPGKHPVTPHGFKDATTDPATVKQWWADDDFNVGLRTGDGLLVFDVDPRHGGGDSLQDLVEANGPLPKTVEAITGGAGRHLFFATQRSFTNRANVRAGLDVRADGGYVVVPPSVHASGGSYRWVVGQAPGEIQAAALPDWLDELINRPQQHATRQHTSLPDGVLIQKAQRYVAACSPAGEGSRNQAVFSVAGHLLAFENERGDRLSTEQVLGLVRTYNWRCSPPLSDSELQQAVESAGKNGTPRQPKNVDGDRGPVVLHDPANPLSLSSPEGLTDLSNARRLKQHFGDRLRFVHAWRNWLLWDGMRWREDDDGAVDRLAASIADTTWREARAGSDQNALRFAAYSASVRGIRAMVTLAEPLLPVGIGDLDQNPWLWNAANGTVDLRTGELRDPRREDYLTKSSPVEFDPDAASYNWDRFLEDIFDGDQSLVDFLQRLAGYCLTGDVREQTLMIAYGTGANGKSTLLNCLLSVWGDYGSKAPPDLLMARRAADHPTAVADLFGRRLVVAAETGESRLLDESRCKELTGGDQIAARRMRQDFFTFRPTHKLVLATNHRPAVRGTDHGLWRRLRLVPFDVVFDGDRQDKALPERLARELPGILAWAVRGCLDWQRDGLGLPEPVEKATKAYRTDEDVVAAFLLECCRVAVPESIRSAELYESFSDWSRQAGERPLTRKAFGQRLRERGFSKRKTGGLIVWLGLSTTHSPREQHQQGA